MSMKSRRLQMSKRDMENMAIDWMAICAIIMFCTSLLYITLAGIACTPAVRPVPASHPTYPPYNLAMVGASEQARASEAGELSTFYRNNF